MEDNNLPIQDWYSNLKKKLSNNFATTSIEERNEVFEAIFDNLVDELVLEVVFDLHKSQKVMFSEYNISDEDIRTYSIVDSNDGDIFGQQFVKKSSICHCPRCQRPLSASVFTTHLQNCVGKGRSSARIASLRIANNCIRNAYGGMSDEDDDWISGPEKPKRKKIPEAKRSQDKSNIRHGKNQNKKKFPKKLSKDVIESENSEEL